MPAISGREALIVTTSSEQPSEHSSRPESWVISSWSLGVASFHVSFVFDIHDLFKDSPQFEASVSETTLHTPNDSTPALDAMVFYSSRSVAFLDEFSGASHSTIDDWRVACLLGLSPLCLARAAKAKGIAAPTISHRFRTFGASPELLSY
ncbi:hypothetical protein BD779DRAFT_1679114 [Infundibulicybe gibba]|nr:hypothetical protein BD779DRAFT_1679114 [Infundibulicybe gibba]